MREGHRPAKDEERRYNKMLRGADKKHGVERLDEKGSQKTPKKLRLSYSLRMVGRTSNRR